MTNQLDQFSQRFKEEAIDHINDLEKALMQLEKNPDQKELIENIFRAMHSLKGGGGMFGFDKLSEFTHDLENIYDLIRKGQVAVSIALISITLQSVDLLRDLLDERLVGSKETTLEYERLKKKIRSLVSHASKQALASLEHPHNSRQSPKTSETATYLIHFSPEAEVLRNGSNLLYLTDELASLGSTITIPGVSKVPCLKDLEPTQCFLYWDILLATTHSVEEIGNVFIFVEAASQIDINLLANRNLLEDKGFEERIKQQAKSGQTISASSVKAIIHHEELERTSVQAHTSSLRVSSEKIDSLINLVSELVLSQDRLALISAQNNIPELKQVANTIQKLTAQLRDSAFSISLLPIATLTMRFQRLVRDLSSNLGKEVLFTSSGEDTELDKSMIESITDPLLHIMRNSIDHGIEKPEEREQAGKPRAGNITLKAYYSGANVIIEVTDDGRGLNPSDIRKKAVAKGLIDEKAPLSDQEILDLVFVPGFSTRDTVSDLSGRGVGMDVVKKNITAIRGHVTIHATPGQGTTVTIHLPMILSIIDGLLVTIGQNKYVIPLSLADRIFPLKKKDVKSVFNNILTLEGAQYPFIHLRDCLLIPGDLPERMQAVLVSNKGRKVLFSIDHVEGKIQAVLKPLGRLYQNNPFLSAATILADGSIALVLDPNAIISEY